MKTEKFISIAWYMDRKPYQSHDNYDIFYLKICRSLFEIIDRIAEKYKDGLIIGQNDCRELAYACTAYFEDQVNNIGFWKSLTDLHYAEFGKRLPFFDQDLIKEQEEDENDILKEDIHYLAYIVYLDLLTREDNKTITFLNSPFLTELAQEVFDYLSAIDEVLLTNFYETFLIPDKIYFYFKKKLEWFTFKGYLTAPLFSQMLDKYKSAVTPVENISKEHLVYLYVDELLYEVPSSYTAFFPVDLLAGAMQCQEKKRQQIRDLKKRAHGVYHVLRDNEEYYRFSHDLTGEEFDVWKDSISNRFEYKIDHSFTTTVIAWEEAYAISGLCIQNPVLTESIQQSRREDHRLFLKHSKKYREYYDNIASKDTQEAIAFFGSQLVVFDTGYEMRDKLNEFNQWCAAKKSDHSRPDGKTRPAPIAAFSKRILESVSVALFIPASGVPRVVADHKKILRALQTKDTSEAMESLSLVASLFTDNLVSPEYVLYLKAHFPLTNLSYLMDCSLEAREDIEALLRIQKPKSFSSLNLPELSIVSTDHIREQVGLGVFNEKYDISSN